MLDSSTDTGMASNKKSNAGAEVYLPPVFQGSDPFLLFPLCLMLLASCQISQAVSGVLQYKHVMKGVKVVSELDTVGSNPAALKDGNASMHFVALHNAMPAANKSTSLPVAVQMQQ